MKYLLKLFILLISISLGRICNGQDNSIAINSKVFKTAKACKTDLVPDLPVESVVLPSSKIQWSLLVLG